MEKEDKVLFFHSIKMKIILLVVGAVVVCTAINLWTIIPLIQENSSRSIAGHMQDVVTLAGRVLDREAELLGADAELSREIFTPVASGISVDNLASAYLYVISGDGTVLYHPSTDKIGQPIGISEVKELADSVKGQKGTSGQDMIEYENEGAMEFASFYVSQMGDYIVLLAAREEDVTTGTRMIARRTYQGSNLTLVVCVLFSLVIAILIVRPLEKTTALLGKIARFDFREDEREDAISKRRDESGMIVRSVGNLRREFGRTVRKITGQGEELHQASQVLNSGASETSQSVEQVEKAVSEIAEGATSQAHETQTATENVIAMGNMIQDTNQAVEELRANARAMRTAGNQAMDILGDLSAVNQKTKEAMQVIYRQTNVTNESALKIKEATNLITDIAEETNLLSLNASIEAARAGEQGRGFAIVAAQIQKLAEQSNESASRIEEITNGLIAESQKSVETMEEVKTVIESQDENVKKTGRAFQSVKEGIDKSIEGIRTIARQTEQMDEARIKVVDVVQNLTAIAEENAASTQQTAASAAEVGSIMSTIADNAGYLNQIADGLEESIKQFITE